MQGNLMLPLTIDDTVCGLITFPSYSAPLQLSEAQIEDIERRVLYIAIALNAMFYALELKEKNQLIEQKSRLQRDFMANVSHEIRTPMNAIIGFCRLALQSGLNARQTDYLQKIESSADSLLGIINDILDFSKIEAGKLEIVRTRFTLERILARVSDAVALRAEKKGLALSIDCDPEIPAELLGDPLRLGQVLINLLGNAVKFTASGDVRLKLERLDQAPGNCRIRFLVQDTGIGMTPEQIARLFTAFGQADSSITRQPGGTGLGLAICKQLIELMGGQIRVESLVGKGSVFSFTLDFPLPDAEEAGATQAPATTPAAARKPTRSSVARIAGARILVVEDNLLNQELITEMLAGAGLRIDLADNGREAIEALARREYDLILMDMQMPVMGGMEATRIIRANPVWQRLPIVAMTAHAMKGYREECLAAGMNDYLCKPIDTGELFAVLERWTAQKNSPLLRAAEAAQPARSLKLPDSLPGIDLSEGIRRMRISDLFYVKLLKGFARQYEDFIAPLRTLIAQGQSEEAASQLHSLKGLAGNLSIREVYAHTAQLEKTLRQSATHDPLLLAALEHALQEAIHSIAALPEIDPSPSSQAKHQSPPNG